jgi:hypothetical protein
VGGGGRQGQGHTRWSATSSSSCWRAARSSWNARSSASSRRAGPSSRDMAKGRGEISLAHSRGQSLQRWQEGALIDMFMRTCAAPAILSSSESCCVSLVRSLRGPDGIGKTQHAACYREAANDPTSLESRVTPETKFPNLGTEAHGSELDLKFGCYIFYIGNPDT